ncbi:polyprotein [Phytophthora megakarya]|uniref:Polyprotein n=1 Tax=Phytophthora megakarya TaxID=4795 RepID=A0A225W5H7_9STRA|nr:polyprotein [Phytophthora megakarya]
MKEKQTVSVFPERSLSKTGRVGSNRNAFEGWSIYVLPFVDDYSRYVVGYFLKNKNEVAAKPSEIQAFYENHWGND